MARRLASMVMAAELFIAYLSAWGAVARTTLATAFVLATVAHQFAFAVADVRLTACHQFTSLPTSTLLCDHQAAGGAFPLVAAFVAVVFAAGERLATGVST
jgi:hypothetical protein